MDLREQTVRLFMPYDTWYRGRPDTLNRMRRDNIRDWETFLCPGMDTADIARLIYHSTLEDARNIANAVRDEQYSLPTAWADNDLAEHLVDYGCHETSSYLLYLRRCEPYVTQIKDPWSGAPVRNVREMLSLAKEGIEKLEQTQSHYIRLRYLYQISRLYHYASDYKALVKTYETYRPRIKTLKSVVQYWVWGHYAAGLAKTGKPAQAAYLYMRIFKECPSKAASAFHSFKIPDDATWDQCQKLCKNNAERAALLALRAAPARSIAVEEMQAIYHLQPQSKYLPALLMKELRELEFDFLNGSWTRPSRKPGRGHRSPQSLIDLNLFLQKVVAEKKVPDLEKWELASAYTLLLSGDLQASDELIRQLEGRLPSALEKQRELLQEVYQIVSWTVMDPPTQTAAFGFWQNSPWLDKWPDYEPFLHDRIAYQWEKAKLPGLAFRTRYPLRALQANPNERYLQELIQLSQKEPRTPLEGALLLDAAGEREEDLLLDIQATWFLHHAPVETALEALKKIPSRIAGSTQHNPFEYRIFDPSVRQPVRDASALMTRQEVLERLLELEYKARADRDKGPQAFFDLGMAWYNMSYFGHSWRMLDHFRSGLNWYGDDDHVYPGRGLPLGNLESMDLSRAIGYFRKCLELTPDAELAAKAVFMLARCDMNEYLVSPDNPRRPDLKKVPFLPVERQRYYRLFHKNYQHTRTYKAAVSECKYLAIYGK